MAGLLLFLVLSSLVCLVKSFKPTNFGNLLNHRKAARIGTKTMSTTEDIGAVGSKLTNIDLAKEALSLWVENVDKVDMEATKGGVNNIVQYVRGKLLSNERVNTFYGVI